MSSEPTRLGRAVDSAVSRYRDLRFATAITFVVGFGLLAALPYLVEAEVLGFSIAQWIAVDALILTLIWATASQAWNIMSGYTGQFSFGHAAFFGLGTYVTMKLLVDFGINPWFGLLIAATVAALYGLLVGFLTFRYNLRGHYFALATLAAAELVRTSISNMSEFNGTQGYYRPFAREYADGPGLLAFQFETDLPYYYVILAFLVVVTLVAWKLKHSWVGLYFFAIREDEQAAASLGVPVVRYKLIGVTISAFFTAWVGAYWSMYFLTIRPNTAIGLFKNVEILLPAIVGGPGTVAGPIIGSFVVTPVSEVIRQTFTGITALDRVVFGILLVIIVLYSPEGVIGWPARFRHLVGRVRSLAGPPRETPVADRDDPPAESTEADGGDAR